MNEIHLPFDSTPDSVDKLKFALLYFDKITIVLPKFLNSWDMYDYRLIKDLEKNTFVKIEYRNETKDSLIDFAKNRFPNEFGEDDFLLSNAEMMAHEKGREELKMGAKYNELARDIFLFHLHKMFYDLVAEGKLILQNNILQTIVDCDFPMYPALVVDLPSCPSLSYTQIIKYRNSEQFKTIRRELAQVFKVSNNKKGIQDSKKIQTKIATEIKTLINAFIGEKQTALVIGLQPHDMEASVIKSEVPDTVFVVKPFLFSND